MPDAATTAPERLSFQTEAKQLLQLMIHSLYSHKEVFVRELVSNASDALDRLRFEALTNPSLKVSEPDLAIRIKLDKSARTFTISDNGVGMSRQELIDNIGTIARSGSRAFLEKLTGDQKADNNLIGRFGVGFYSVFMAASRVKLLTRRAGSDEPALQWESDGQSDYSLAPAHKESHGTDITLYLSDAGAQYAERWEVESIIRKYSDFIAFPIYLPDDKGKDQVVNETKPIWKRAPAEVTAEQYEQFYQQALGGFDKPLASIHSRAEGLTEYNALLFIPETLPFELLSWERKHGVKLYVKRVFIMDNCKELLPEYLRFVKGIVDSEDLPLNVSRELLQSNPLVGRIRGGLVGKVLGKLAELAAQDPARYASFWKQFGPLLKEGLHSDHENRDKLLELLRFGSSAGTAEDLVSLKQYVERMRPGQKAVYYIMGESRAAVEKSPHLELLRAKGIEVLFGTDPVDEFVVPGIGEHDGQKLVDVTRGDLDLGDLGKDEREAQKKAGGELRQLAERIAQVLSNAVREVRVTTRLTDSPCCLVLDEHDMGSHMEKLMKAMGREYTPAKPILEINGSHPILLNMNRLYARDPKAPDLEEWSRLLYEQALVAEGQSVPDPLAYSKRVHNLLLKVSGGAA